MENISDYLVVKKEIKEKVIRATLIAGTILFAATGFSEAHINITPTMEQVVGDGQLRSARIAYLKDHPGLQLIQDTIIKGNKDQLIPYKDNFQRGIRPVHMLITNNKEINAYSLAGGHIFVSDAMVKALMAREFNPDTGNTAGVQKVIGNGFEVYGHSALAATLAHEDSHWERNYLQRHVDMLTPFLSPASEALVERKLRYDSDGVGFIREMVSVAALPRVLPATQGFVYQEELAADKGAMEFLDNTEVYSPGSLMTVFARMKDSSGIDDIGSLSPHPSRLVRNRQVIEHIRQLSNGRVQLDEEGRMKLDGKLFMGTGYMPDREDVVSFDRTVFVAGQLAKSINYHAGTKGNPIFAISDDSAYERAGNKTILVARNNGTTKRNIVIDKFDFTREDARKIVEGKDVRSTKEHKSAREIVKFLKSN